MCFVTHYLTFHFCHELHTLYHCTWRKVAQLKLKCHGGKEERRERKKLFGFKLSQVLLGLLHAILIVPPGSTGASQETLCWSWKRWWRWLWCSVMLADKCRMVLETEMIIKKMKLWRETLKSAPLYRSNLACTMFPLATSWNIVQKCA